MAYFLISEGGRSSVRALEVWDCACSLVCNVTLKLNIVGLIVVIFESLTKHSETSNLCDLSSDPNSLTCIFVYFKLCSL